MAEKERLQQLFDRFLQKECTPEEVEELVQLLRDEEVEDVLTPDMQKLWEQVKSENHTYPIDWQKMYEEITAHEALVVKERQSSKRIWWRVAAAVAVVIITTAVIYTWYQNTVSRQTPKEVAHVQQKILPGGNKAVLTLANGATIILDQANKGNLAKQGNSNIIKLDSGTLAYEQANKEEQGNIEYNSLTTPKGGQYQLKLPDGTKVWLNATSSIRYPTSFSGMEKRDVKITGEVYFEVAQNVNKPFIVVANNMQVKVLGTHFNINAYADEPTINTTLLQGSVKVSTMIGTENAVILKPGQQAQLDKEGEMQLMKKPFLDEAVAWKKGLFVFHDDNLPAIMRKLARWYDVQVEYKDGVVPSSHFTGAVQRKVEISKVFKMLELTGGAHFEIEGRKIVVSS